MGKLNIAFLRLSIPRCYTARISGTLHTCVTSQGNFYPLAASRYSYLTATCYFAGGTNPSDRKFQSVEKRSFAGGNFAEWMRGGVERDQLFPSRRARERTMKSSTTSAFRRKYAVERKVASTRERTKGYLPKGSQWLGRLGVSLRRGGFGTSALGVLPATGSYGALSCRGRFTVEGAEGRSRSRQDPGIGGGETVRQPPNPPPSTVPSG